MAKKYSLPSTPLFHALLQRVRDDVATVVNNAKAVEDPVRVGLSADLMLHILSKADFTEVK